jgi:hypothetical protein
LFITPPNYSRKKGTCIAKMVPKEEEEEEEEDDEAGFEA